MVLLKTIFLLVLVYYLAKILWHLFAPRIVGYATKKAEEHFQQNFGDPARESKNEGRVGETIIDKQPEHHKKESKKVGEYIDFEEID